MNRLFLFVTVIIGSFSSVIAQKCNPEVICATDTLTLEPSRSMKVNPKNSDSTQQEPYEVLRCIKRSKWGLRMEMAYSNYYYGAETTDWLGQHGGANFNLALAMDHFNFGVRFKPGTVTPNKELEFYGILLPTSAKLNNIRIDYYVGYSFDLEKMISIEPYLGYNHTTFKVINEDELNQTYALNAAGGVILGTSVNKYFKLMNYNYLSVFGTIGYGWVDYQKVHAQLANNYWEWNVGLAFKVFAAKQFNKGME